MKQTIYSEINLDKTTELNHTESVSSTSNIVKMQFLRPTRINLHYISSKKGFQILTCLQMNKSRPLQVISKLVTSDGSLMHLLWFSLSSQWRDFGCSEITLKRGIWLPSGLCCFPAAQKHISWSTQKWHSSLLVLFFSSALHRNLSTPSSATRKCALKISQCSKKTEKISINIQLSFIKPIYLAHMFLCVSKAAYCCVSDVVLKLQNTGRWQGNWNSLTVDCILMTRKRKWHIQQSRSVTWNARI